MDQPTERFTRIVAEYIKYRPSYPEALLEFLIKTCHLTQQSLIADIGSGTGLLSRLFLSHNMHVWGVEPNDAMRQAGETLLKDFSHFKSIKGEAEATSLPANYFDLVTAGTAFHWFDAEKSKVEFTRILRKPGWAALIWNVRDVAHSELMRDYEALINQYNKDFKTTNASKFDETVSPSFFSPYPMLTASFPNQQLFNWEGFMGRLLSSSYSLSPNDVQYEEMIVALKKIFTKHARVGRVRFLYETRVYCGRLR